MSEPDEKLREMVRHALGPVAETELKRDLWPRMRERMERREVRVPWWDWALAAAVLLCLALFPGAIPAVLYQL
jgi:type VI protein secretion system component VasF